jgi:hypothetical protein
MFNGSLNTQFQFGDMPTGLTPMPLMDEDEDFLAMLQSTIKPAAISTMTTANPADLSSNSTVLRNIQLSPSPSESSPSPPNHDTNSASNIYNIYNNQDMASRATRSANKDPFSGEPSSKRKQLDDLDEESDEDAPQRKQQHTDGSCMYIIYIVHPAPSPIPHQPVKPLPMLTLSSLPQLLKSRLASVNQSVVRLVLASYFCDAGRRQWP